MTEETTGTAGTNQETTPNQPELSDGAGKTTGEKAAVKTAPKKAAKSTKAVKTSKPSKPAKKPAPTKTGKKAVKAPINKAGKAKAKTVKVEKSERQRQMPNKKYPRVSDNPYRQATNYALAFDILANTGKMKPVSRKELLAAFIKTGRDAKLAAYDLAVVLSPAKNGEGHKSSRKEKYYVERFENGFVRLHMA